MTIQKKKKHFLNGLSHHYFLENRFNNNLLNEKYHGTITNLLKKAHNKHELDLMLQEFNGIGPITSQIFMQGLEKSNILTSLVF